MNECVTQSRPDCGAGSHARSACEGGEAGGRSHARGEKRTDEAVVA